MAVRERQLDYNRIPSPNNQITSNYQYPRIWLLEFGDWLLFGIWPACRRQGFGYRNLAYAMMMRQSKEGTESLFFEPISNLFSPDFYSFVSVRITFFEMFHKTLYQFTPRGKDGQTDHDEEYPLQDWEKETKNSQNNEEPADDQNTDCFDVTHSIDLFKTDLIIYK